MKVVSKKDFIYAFKKIGIKQGMDLVVHSSLSRMGYIVNGPKDIIDALSEIINLKKGTIILPSHSSQLSDPRQWARGGFSKAEKEKIRLNMSYFDKKFTLPSNRGILSNHILNYKSAYRSDHPLNSFCGIGKNAKKIMSQHSLLEPEGINSPLGKLYFNRGYILLIGVKLDKCTAIHLAENIAGVKYLERSKVRILVKINNKKKFVVMKKYATNSDKFNKLYKLPEIKNIIKKININKISLNLISIYDLVNISVKILKKKENFFK